MSKGVKIELIMEDLSPKDCFMNNFIFLHLEAYNFQTFLFNVRFFLLYLHFLSVLRPPRQLPNS